ncbi:MAG TPA: hypothetical protein VK993_15295, partial [Chthoniobacterales bacterium]|nr:hypothetical protein [Chthoniobacterales bacterium]
GSQAVEEATEACRRNDWQHWNLLDTLAAAYAEIGDFQQAVKHQEQALAATNVSAESRKELEHRLALYQAGMPYRELPKP